jgi:protease-4
MRNPDISITEEEQTLLKNLHQDAYQQLTKLIAASRKLSLTTIANWAEGKIFTGHQALNLGLINEIGSMCTVRKIIKEKALIENEIEWVENKKNCYGNAIAPISSLAIKIQ